jgi:hypothetical protein
MARISAFPTALKNRPAIMPTSGTTLAVDVDLNVHASESRVSVNDSEELEAALREYRRTNA